MSKVAERMDAKRTRCSCPRGRFLLRDRGTQPGAVWWGCPRPSSPPRAARKRFRNTVFEDRVTVSRWREMVVAILRTRHLDILASPVL